MSAFTPIAGAPRVRWGRLLSAVDAAEYLGISLTTLRDLDIATKPLGRRRLYDIRALDRFADQLGAAEARPNGGAPDPGDVAAAERAFFEKRRKRRDAN